MKADNTSLLMGFIAWFVVVWGVVSSIGVYFYYGALMFTTYTFDSLPFVYWVDYLVNAWLGITIVTIPIFVISMILIMKKV